MAGQYPTSSFLRFDTDFSDRSYDSPAMTVLRLAHLDLEGLVLDSKVKNICSYISNEWSQCLYNGMYSFPHSHTTY